MRPALIILSIIIIITTIGLFVRGQFSNNRVGDSNQNVLSSSSSASGLATTSTAPSSTASSPVVTAQSSLPVIAKVVLPIDQFYLRITIKTFGMYITPKTSPVQPERFTGYHTGDDVEYGDVTGDVAVRAIAKGVAVRSGVVSGYGGMVAIKHQIEGQNLIAIYGHLRPSSLVKNGDNVAAGQQIGVLGTAYSSETDGERRHLHFALRSNDVLDVRGYVQSKSELSGWQDPIQFFKSHGL